MKLSAIVPTHNRPGVLQQCLETLQAQDIDPSRFEVMVVDDGSPTDIAAVVAEARTRGSMAIRCERQELSGLNAARNRGVAVTQGEVVAFLDDDTLVSPGWAAAMVEAFERYPCAGVGGRIELGLAVPAPEWLAGRRYYLAEYDLGSEPRWLDGDPVPVGANCAVRRSEFDRVGGFRPGLDRIAGSLVSNGDTDFFRRLCATGARLRYEPAASVVHCVPADRLTVGFFARRHYAQGVSDELLRALEGDPQGWRHRVRLVGGMVDGAKALCKDMARGRATVDGRFEVNYWAGRLKASVRNVRAVKRIAGGDQRWG
jgi:glycosyltransferase involved in cell wall biosynthesis